MAETLKLGNGDWATKEGSLLAYSNENGNYKPLPFDVTRASSATVVNKQGLIETVGSGIPRIDFSDDAKGALLLEPQRSNLVTYSEPTTNEGAASNITYQSFNWSIGFENCVKFGDNSALRFRYFSTVLVSTTYTISAFVIMDDLSEPSIGTNASTGDFVFRVGGVYPTITSKQNMGNNIWRCEGYATTVNTSQTGIMKYTGQSSKGFRVVGFQLEQGSYATSYIPTSGQANGVTRVADACNNGANEQVINSTEGVLYAEIEGLVDGDTDRAISLNDDSFSNSVVINYHSLSGFVFFQVYKTSVRILNFSVNNVDKSISHKIAFKYKNADYSVWIDGVEVLTNTLADNISANTLSKLNFDRGDGVSDFYGNIKDIRVYNTALTDQELIALTTI